MNEQLLALLKEVQGTPLYDQLANYLMARRNLPEITAGYTGSANAKFEQPGLFASEIPNRGRITINRDDLEYKVPDLKGSMTHEMNHAADEQLSWQAHNIKRKSAGDRTKEEQQFLDAYQKLEIGKMSESKVIEFAKKLDPKWVKENSDYRSTHTELGSFGVGNSVNARPGINQKNSWESPDHLDATLATERSILLDAAMRAQAQQPIRGR